MTTTIIDKLVKCEQVVSAMRFHLPNFEIQRKKKFTKTDKNEMSTSLSYSRDESIFLDTQENEGIQNQIPGNPVIAKNFIIFNFK